MSYILSDVNFSKLSEYIYRKSGIYLEFEKHYDKLAKYIDSRCGAINVESFRQYFFKLRFEDKDGEEFQELINAITVNETYFFREKDQFEVLANQILPKLHAVLPDGQNIRILSAPCSSGEEPLSIVLYILEEGKVVNERDIEIVGIDIDSNIIKKANSYKYSDRSVHAIPPDLLEKYFVKQEIGYSLTDELKESVHFQLANVFDKEQMHELGRFDIIFSRNMLIYFDDSSRKEVAMTFYDLLNPGGYVLLGHAEYMSRIVSVYKVKKFDNTLVYQK